LEENNLVDFIATGQTQPGLAITAQGVEVEALVRVGDVSFDLDFQHQDAEEVDADGTALPRPSLPDTTASLWTMYEPIGGALRGLRLGAGVRYASQNESNGTAFLAANNFAPTPNRIVTEGYTVFDALIGYRFADGLEASLNVRNLGDKQYFATCLSRGDCFPGEQRTIVGSLAYRF
jgi:iron complex outermembrane receptor protein